MSELLFAVFAALGWAILHSLWIAVLVGGLHALLSRCFPEQLNLRYQAGGFALMIILISSVGVFLNSLAERWPLALEQFSAVSATPLLLEIGAASVIESDRSTTWTVLLGLLWLVGAALSTWRLWRSHRLLRDMAQKAAFGGALHELALELSKQLRLRLPVRVAISEWIDVPCVIGLLKPLILVPSALVARLPADQMELILLHELSHVKNGDLWVNALQIVVEVLMFFHPSVHWISADLRALRERRCDRSVLEIRPTPVRYAQTLLRLEEFRQEFRGLAIAASGGELSTRVRDILMPRLNGPARPSQGAALLSAIALTALLAGSVTQMMTRQKQHNTASEPSSTALISPQNADAMPVARVIPQPPQRSAAPVQLIAQDTPALSAVLQPESAQGLALEQARLALRSATQRSARNKPIQLASLGSVDLRSVAEPQLPDDLLPSADFLTTPKLIRQINPVFHPGAQREYYFSMSFRLNAKGLPQEIRFEKGSATASQIEAAAKALAKWRFDPRESAKFGDKRLAQAFNFKEIDRPCVPVLGSRICRRVAR